MIELAEIEAARERIAGAAIRTPLVRLHVEDGPAEIYLKLREPPADQLVQDPRRDQRGHARARRASGRRGLVTASAGNMAQGVAWAARELGVPATIAVPEHAPQAKLAAIERLGGRVLKLPYDDWWNVIVTSRVDGIEGLFVHPVQDPGVMAGNGTIGLEILEDLPDPDAVVIPYGGGGLTVGIASAVKALRPDTKIFTAEPETGAALAAAFAAGQPGRRRLPRLVRGRRPAAAACSTACGRWSRPSSTAPWRSRSPRSPPPSALLAERARVIAEGAGALALAAALAGRAGPGKIVCIVSGGNINLSKLAEILNGLPDPARDGAERSLPGRRSGGRPRRRCCSG